MKVKTLLKSEIGNATIMVTVLAVVATMIAVAIIRVGQGTSQGDFQHLRFYNTIEIIKANFFAVIDNGNAWDYTILLNKAKGTPKMVCISSGATCSIATSQVSYLDEANATTYYGETIFLADRSNTQIYDPTSNTQGFTISGASCNTYSKLSVVSGCAIRVRVAWQPFCQTDCLVPPAPTVLRVNFFTPAKTLTTGLVPGILFNQKQTDGIIPEMNAYR